MRTDVADNWFAEVDRFAASSLRMIFVGQRGCKRILLISARGFAISLNSLIPYLGKIMRTSDWTAASAKKPEHGSKQIRGI